MERRAFISTYVRLRMPLFTKGLIYIRVSRGGKKKNKKKVLCYKNKTHNILTDTAVLLSRMAVKKVLRLTKNIIPTITRGAFFVYFSVLTTERHYLRHYYVFLIVFTIINTKQFEQCQLFYLPQNLFTVNIIIIIITYIYLYFPPQQVYILRFW